MSIVGIKERVQEQTCKIFKRLKRIQNLVTVLAACSKKNNIQMQKHFGGFLGQANAEIEKVCGELEELNEQLGISTTSAQSLP